MFFDKDKKNFSLYENDQTVFVSEENWNEIELVRQSAKKYELIYNEADKKVEISVAPSIYHEYSNALWIYKPHLELSQLEKAKTAIFKDIDDTYRNKKQGAFAVDITDTVKNLNKPNTTNILFPTNQASFNLIVGVKPATCENEKIVSYATNKIQYKDHDRCVLWIQDSRDIQSLVSLGHVLAAEWSSKNNGSSIFDYVHYQKVGIAGVQYNATQIRTAQPDGYPIVLDKHSLKMWCFIFNKINEKKEQLHGRYFLLKTQIQNCTTMDELESVRQRINTGWVEVFSDTQTPAGLTVIS
jgi:hypothetical protein